MTVKTTFTQWWHILKTVKNVTVAKFELAFTWWQNNLNAVLDTTVINSLQGFDAKEMYLHSKNQSVLFQKRWKMFCFHHVECSHNAVAKMCRLEFRFQNLPFLKSTGKKCAIFVLKGGLSVTFSLFSKCAGIVWKQSKASFPLDGFFRAQRSSCCF